MLQDAATRATSSTPEAADFPADVQDLSLTPSEFAAGGVQVSRLTLTNSSASVLHARLTTEVEWLTVSPAEIALGSAEKQVVLVRVDIARARAAVRNGLPSSGPIRVSYQWIGLGAASGGLRTGTVRVNLPVARCPACQRSLDDAIASGGVSVVPEFCPYCFERLRPCPVCGALNSWLMRQCWRDPAHVLRLLPDWNCLGGNPAHTGAVDVPASPTLVRRWSYPAVPPLRRENALNWSAPAAAYGLVVAVATAPDGETHVYSFDARNGASLWDAYPLPDPVYPDRGGCALAGGKLFAATVEGVCVALDAQRGTRIWEKELSGRVYGAVVAAREEGPLLVPVMGTGSGVLYALRVEDGSVLWEVALPGTPDCAPAYATDRVFVHDDSGVVTACDVRTGEILWQATNNAEYNAAPVVSQDSVYSADGGGRVTCRRAGDGAEVWQLPVTNAPFSGTPACDGSLLYLPADDGVHLVSVAGRAVRRFPMRLPVRSAPVVARGTLFFGAGDGSVYGAKPGRSPERLYEAVGTGIQIMAAPAFADGALFIVATNGLLYALSYGTEAGNDS